MTALFILFVVALGSFVAGSFYGKRWEQQAIAELLKAKQQGEDLFSAIISSIMNRVSKYL